MGEGLGGTPVGSASLQLATLSRRIVEVPGSDCNTADRVIGGSPRGSLLAMREGIITMKGSLVTPPWTLAVKEKADRKRVEILLQLAGQACVGGRVAPLHGGSRPQGATRRLVLPPQPEMRVTAEQLASGGEGTPPPLCGLGRRRSRDSKPSSLPLSNVREGSGPSGGANAILALRCAHLNGRFEDYWEGRPAPLAA